MACLICKVCSIVWYIDNDVVFIARNNSWFAKVVLVQDLRMRENQAIHIYTKMKLEYFFRLYGCIPQTIPVHNTQIYVLNGYLT